jgi:hypothetical protein
MLRRLMAFVRGFAKHNAYPVPPPRQEDEIEKEVARRELDKLAILLNELETVNTAQLAQRLKDDA